MTTQDEAVRTSIISLSRRLEEAVREYAPGNGALEQAVAEYLYNIHCLLSDGPDGDQTQADVFVPRLFLDIADGYRLEDGKWVMPCGSARLSFDYEAVFVSVEDRESFTSQLVELFKTYRLPNGYFTKWSDSCPLCYTPFSPDGTCPNERCPRHTPSVPEE